MNAKGENNGLLSHVMKNGSLPMRTVQAIKEFAIKPLEQKTAFILQNYSCSTVKTKVSKNYTNL